MQPHLGRRHPLSWATRSGLEHLRRPSGALPFPHLSFRAAGAPGHGPLPVALASLGPVFGFRGAPRGLPEAAAAAGA
eukprot:13615871-Alexandrium_andersonii.AAC.1